MPATDANGPIRYLALETGGTKLVAGLAGPDGVLLETRVLRRGASDQAADSLARLVDVSRGLLGGARPQAVGFGYGGGVHRARRQPLECFHESGWDAVDPVRTLEEAFQAPVYMENDCKVAALAEAVLGAGQGARTVLYLTLGTGVGGGLVRDGRIVELSDHGEAEIGHLQVEPDGPPCPCGRQGCLEALCSGPGLAGLAREAGLADPTGPALMEAWRNGDSAATRQVERAADGLAAALGAAMTLLAPQAIVIGGGVGAANPDFIRLASERAKHRFSSYFQSFFKVVPAALGEAVVTQGAALLAARGNLVST
ncbi:MAG: ROK family protein [Acidobacteria bacterium]|nr:ROK family protein [Acidobacteriota bacterium]